jgi:hypothetical protein
MTDEGRLSPEETELTSHGVYRYAEQEEGWLYQQLTVAMSYRRRADRLSPGSPEYADAVHRRRMALKSALIHYDNLVKARHPIDELITEMMKAEGL